MPHLQLIYPLKVLIFHSYVDVDQRLCGYVPSTSTNPRVHPVRVNSSPLLLHFRRLGFGRHIFHRRLRSRKLPQRAKIREFSTKNEGLDLVGGWATPLKNIS